MTMDEEQVTEWVKAQREQASVPTPPRKQTAPKKYVTRQDQTGVGEWPAVRREPIPTTCPRCSRRLLGSSRWCQVHGDYVDVGAMPYVEEHVIRYEGRRRAQEEAVLHGHDGGDRESNEERED